MSFTIFDKIDFQTRWVNSRTRYVLVPLCSHHNVIVRITAEKTLGERNKVSQLIKDFYRLWALLNYLLGGVWPGGLAPAPGWGMVPPPIFGIPGGGEPGCPGWPVPSAFFPSSGG